MRTGSPIHQLILAFANLKQLPIGMDSCFFRGCNIGLHPQRFNY